MVALSGTAILGLVVGALAALAFAGVLVWLVVRRQPERKPDIPAGMRPGPADEVLERRMVERFIGWSLVFVVFFAAWIPVLWFMEPNTNAAESEALTQRSITRGSEWFEVSSSENPTGFGCARCHGPEGAGGEEIPFEGGFVQPPALVDVCGGEATGHPLIKSIDDIRTTIEQGREGTAMPSWSINYEGPMNDQQIDDLINYLLTIQELPEDARNVCLNPVTEDADVPEDTGEEGAA